VPLSIFLTSDLHLGMKFAGLPEVREELCEARFACLQRLVSLSNQRRSDLLVIAGDLFERISVSRRDVERAAEMLRDFQGRLVAVLPGNHDYLSPEDELWKRFRQASGDAVLLLEERMPYGLAHFGIDACLYPGTCFSKHSKANAIGWVRTIQRDRSLARHIGVAHGSLEGFSPDFNGDYYPMSSAELMGSGLDLWLLGHTHVLFPRKPGSRDRIFYAGTPEPDGFDCAHEGYALSISIGDDGALSSEALPTGAYRFMHEEAEIRDAGGLSAIEKRYSGPEAKRVLLKAVLRGRLPPEAHPELERVRERLSKRLMHLEWDADGVREEISRQAIDDEYPEGSFPHRLLVEISGSADTEALQLAYELLHEARR
jgi:exonuclease SbcD